jgi:flagellar hook protein FlgE
LDGPKVGSNTLLTNIVRSDGAVDNTNYISMFQEGTILFNASKGGRDIYSESARKEFTVTSTTTVQELVDFMNDAMGIQPASNDTTNPIPGSNNTLGTGTLAAGGSIIGGRIRFVANNGTANAVDVSQGGLQLYDTSGVLSGNVNLDFGEAQTAIGESAVTDFVVFDTLGIPIDVRVTAVLENRSDSGTVYRWFAESSDNSPLAGDEIAVGTGLIQFDGEGNFVNATESTVSIDRRNIPSSSPLEFELSFDEISGLNADQSSLAASRQDGSGPGTLTSFIIGEDGTIRGVFSNGVTRDLGRIQLTRFANPAGLEQRGENLFAPGVNSGLPINGNPGTQGIGTIIAGAVELSNTDIGQSLIDLILASTQYRSNTRIVNSAQELLDELLNLRR